jgi:hypothetical protein
MHTQTRRFTLHDAIILVAALSAGFALARLAWSESIPLQRFPRSFQHRFMIEDMVKAISACVALLSVALLGLRLRSPRTLISQLWREPGVVGCATATISIAWFCATYLLAVPRPSLSSLLLVTPAGVGMAIGSAWLVIWCDGSWQTEPHWIERTGRALCICWFLLPLLFFFG